MLCSIEWLLCRIALTKAAVSWRTDSKATVSCPRTPILWMLFKTRREINIKHRGESLVYFSARILTFGNRKDLGNVSWAIETFGEREKFQRTCIIILGPPKHVLHLVWSAFVKSTAMRTALKIAQGQYQRTIKLHFGLGPSVRFVSAPFS